MNLLDENYQRNDKGIPPRMEIDERDILRADSERDFYPDFTDDDAPEKNESQDSIAETDEISSDEESYENIDPDPEGDDYSDEA